MKGNANVENAGKNERARILVAEDDRTTAFLMASILADAGYETFCARDGEACLQMARDLLPDLIILDLLMPKVHGLDVLKRLRGDEKTRNLGVVVCSAKDYKTESDQAKELGIYGFLSKPVAKVELQSMLTRYFSQEDAGGMQGGDQMVNAQKGEVFKPDLRTEQGMFRLWGTRGSIPVSGPQYVRHGGNTSCMEVISGDERILFDAGSGIRELGLSLLSAPPRKLHLFITHTHWDHIQGFPFFTPTFIPGYEISIYAPPNIDQDLESIFRGQLDRAYFPVQMEDMKARLNFIFLEDEPVRIGNVEVSWEYTFHPGSTVGYKVALAGKKLAYMPDNEFLRGHLGPPLDKLDDEMASIHGKLINFLGDVDVLLHESQYAQEEYPTHIGWGHTSVANGCTLAKLSGVPRWIIIHHDPSHADDFLQDKLNLTRQLLADLDCSVEVINGYDGMVGYL